jgi:hypothetical protein
MNTPNNKRDDSGDLENCPDKKGTTILEQIPYEEFKRLLQKTLEEDKILYEMLADA